MKTRKVVVVLLLSAASALTQTYSYTTLDHPDGTFTLLEGINEQGVIVGGYTNSNVDPPDTLHGFVYHGGSFVQLDFPNASFTLPTDINRHGWIVGTYIDPTGQHGFTLKDRHLETVDYPGAHTTVVTGITNNGVLAGFFIDSVGIHGFLRIGQRFLSLDHPATTAGTLPNGVNNSLQATGQWNLTRAFLYEHRKGTWADFAVPGSDLTIGEDINNPGRIVGLARDPTSLQLRGFLKVGDTYTAINFQGAASTGALGLNDAGQIVGFYVDANGVQHGFVATSQ